VLNSAIGLGVMIGAGALNVAGFNGAMLSASVVIIPAIILMISAGVRARTEPAFL
jgi:DHA1 family purine ribonucleoside efflux pump-like MFS transporter